MPLAKTLAADDLQHGMYVVIREHRLPLGEDESPLINFITEHYCQTEFNLVRPGVPLEVVQKSLPFVLCEIVGSEDEGRRAVTLDVRHCQISEVEPAYAQSYLRLSKLQKKSEPQVDKPVERERLALGMSVGMAFDDTTERPDRSVGAKQDRGTGRVSIFGGVQFSVRISWPRALSGRRKGTVPPASPKECA